jgi:2Fe-2S ferredoxin
MPNVIFTSRRGKEVMIDAPSGVSLMESLRDSGQSDIVAVCGGCSACATCHVYVDEPWLESVGLAGANEIEIIRESPHYQENSRLSCQIFMKDAHDGLRVTIAPED